MVTIGQVYAWVYDDNYRGELYLVTALLNKHECQLLRLTDGHWYEHYWHSNFDNDAWKRIA